MTISSLIQTCIAGRSSKRGTGGRQCGHSRLNIRSIAARAMIGYRIVSRKEIKIEKKETEEKREEADSAVICF